MFQNEKTYLMTHGILPVFQRVIKFSFDSSYNMKNTLNIKLLLLNGNKDV